MADGRSTVWQFDRTNFFQPRERVVAARTAGGLLAVGGAVAALFSFTNTVSPRYNTVVFVSAGALVILGIWMTANHRRTPQFLFLAAPVIGLIIIVGLDLTTRDTSAAAQVFICLPVLYAATQLHRTAAYCVLVLSVLADAVIVGFGLPFAQAVVDFVFMATVVTAIAVLQVRTRDRQEALAAELRRLAAIDPLTGLVTRRVLDDAAQSALLGAQRAAGTALIIVDVDKFKRINDNHGHPVGDNALIHVCGVLTALSRNEDVLCRIGGDEVGILIPGCTQDEGHQRALQIVEAVRDSPLLLANGVELPLTVSVGVAHAPTVAGDLAALYAAADAGLYAAKRAGRDQVGG